MSNLNWIGNMSNSAEVEEVLDKYNLIKKRVKIILRFWMQNEYIDEDDIFRINVISDKEMLEIADVRTCGMHKTCNCKMFYVDYECSLCDDSVIDSEFFPTDWLFLSENSLRIAIKEERGRREAVLEEREATRKAEAKRISEEKERAEYERLKAKFEGVK